MLQGINDDTHNMTKDKRKKVIRGDLSKEVGNSVSERSFSITEETEQFILNDASY